MQRFITILTLFALLSAPCINAQRAKSGGTRVRNNAARVKNTPVKEKEIPAEVVEQDVTFLYRYMPLCDKADYKRSFFETNVRLTRQALNRMSWGKDVPEQLIQHFVLPLRVNNEPLDSFRIKYFEELTQRVKGMDMEKAALEINHWCHEHVTYQPTDERTSSPLQSIRTAYGRCGEESTLCVAAMRVIGIPARQVYTPRWAHTDDNHAWVEVWVNGKWHFMGACEPEAVLDLGWFNAPASRGMMMHTKVFGKYEGPEETVIQTPTYTEINVTSNYAPTHRVNITVKDAAGNPVEGARVDFRIYNYAEFYPAVTRYTDTNGDTYLSAGRGDLLVWASKDGNFGYKKVSFTEDDEATIVLNKTSNSTIVEDFDVNVPPTNFVTPSVTAEQRAENERRLKQEDAIRAKYEATMPKEPVSKTDENGLFLYKARGNANVIRRFLDRYGDNALPLLRSLTEKDLRDVTTEVLEDHQRYSVQLPDISGEMYQFHVLCPRVASEPLSAYKKFFRDKAFKFPSVDSIRQWCKENLRLETNTNTNGTYITPVGVYETRTCDLRSYKLFFVSVCRFNGFPAWVDPVTGELQTAELGLVKLDESETEKVPIGYGTLQLHGNPALTYYKDFTLSKIENGRPQLFTFPEETTLKTLDNKQGMAMGNYLLTTGTRCTNGNVKAQIRTFTIVKNNTAHMLVAPRKNKEENTKFGRIRGVEGQEIVMLIAQGQEPSNHVLRDIASRKDAFENDSIAITAYFANTEQQRNFRASEFPAMPQQMEFKADADGSLLDQLARTLPLHNASNLPIVVLTDENGEIIFFRQGYTIGIGDELLKLLKK